MVFTNARKYFHEISVRINKNPLEKYAKYKYFGKTFDEKLNLKDHIAYVCKKVLNVLHNNIIRIITLKRMPTQFRLCTKTLFKSIGILQIKDIYELELAKFMHGATDSDISQNLNKVFMCISSTHRYPASSSRERVFINPNQAGGG